MGTKLPCALHSHPWAALSAAPSDAESGHGQTGTASVQQRYYSAIRFVPGQVGLDNQVRSGSRRFERLPGLWTVKTGQPKICATDLRMLSLEDAPPVAMIRLGGFGMPNLSAWPRIDSIWPSMMARTYRQAMFSISMAICLTRYHIN